MNQPKALLTKAQREKREAKRYLWHLESPIVGQFKHSHWWQASTENTPIEAIVWEIFRRHPDNYELFIRHRTGLAALGTEGELSEGDFGTNLAISGAAQAGDRLLFAALCFHSWPEFSKLEKKMWRQVFHAKIKPQRGCYPSAVIVLNEYRKTAILNGKRAKADPKENPRFLRYMATLAITQPADFLCDCEDHDRQGRMVIAINPAAPQSRIAAAVKAAVKAWPGHLESPAKEKNRLADTVALIAEFERAELARTSKQKRDDQLFKRYREVIRPWFWEF